MLRNDTSEISRRLSFGSILILVFILLAASIMRFWHLGQSSYNLDELWTLELSTGRGSAHFYEPHDVLIEHFTDVTSLRGAPPTWKIWTNMEDVTHPPLYFLVLRIWREIFGGGELSGRVLSVLAGVAAIGVLFDVVRVLSGVAPALWSCAIMAVAAPQIELARQTRNYALLVLVALLAADALVRMAIFGSSPRRLIALCLALVAALLTHYFCVGAVAGLFVFALLQLKGRDRNRAIGCFLIASIVFAICWGPFMWQQRNRFAASDETTAFLQSHSSNHTVTIVELFLSSPARLIANTPRPTLLITSASALLLLMALIALRRRRDLLFWMLWLVGTLAPLLLLDLLRNTSHLGYIRYLLLAGPGVYAILPAITRIAALRVCICVGAIIFAILAFPLDSYRASPGDSKQIIDSISARLKPNDAIVCAGQGSGWYADNQYLFISHYLREPAPLVLLTRRAGGRLLEELRGKDHLYVFSDESPKDLLPSFKIIGRMNNPAFVDIWLMQPGQ